MRRAAICALILVLAAAGAGLSTPALARGHAAAAAVTTDALDEIERAIKEQRFVDASRWLDELLLASPKDPRLALLSGDLNLAQGRYAMALAAYKAAAPAPAVQSRALEGQGVCLSLLGRSDEALAMLQKAVGADPLAWRAWNALGSEYDARADWAHADQAYDKAMAASDGAAIVLNNRGYSHLLRRELTPAAADFVAALRRKPDFAEARTNLRLALAMQGDYDRAVAGGSGQDRATLLNNAGFAAAMRGDYTKAEDLLSQAMAVKGEYYRRASENLKVVHALAEPAGPAARAHP